MLLSMLLATNLRAEKTFAERLVAGLWQGISPARKTR